MRPLIIASLRLFILFELIQDLTTVVAMVAYGISSDLNSFLGAPILSLTGSIVLYILVFWKAPWIVERLRLVSSENVNVAVNAKSIVACGLVLFGVFGIAEQLIRSLEFFNYVFGGQFSSSSPSFGPGKPLAGAIFTIFRLLIYLYCIVGAGRIAEAATKRFSAESDPK